MKLFAPAFYTSFAILSGCSSPQIIGEFTPGADVLFQEFSKCRTDIFEHVANNKTKFENLGLMSEQSNGMWFNGKPHDGGSKERIYRFEKPLKISGLNAVAAAYAFYKGDGTGYSDGDSTFWGFYFAEDAKTVHAVLRDQYPGVAGMRIVYGSYANMRITDKGSKRTEQGALLSDDASKSFAKSYYSCTVQIKLLDKR